MAGVMPAQPPLPCKLAAAVLRYCFCENKSRAEHVRARQPAGSVGQGNGALCWVSISTTSALALTLNRSATGLRAGELLLARVVD